MEEHVLGMPADAQELYRPHIASGYSIFMLRGAAVEV